MASKGLLAVGFALIPIVVVACSSQESAVGGSNPFDEFAKTKTEAQQELYTAVGDCLREQGWAIGDLALPAVPEASFDYSNWQSPDASIGYGITSELNGGSEERSEDPLDVFARELSVAEGEAFAFDRYGDDQTRGCEDVEVSTPAVEQMDQMQAELRTLAARVDADPQVIESWGEWSQCVEDATGQQAQTQGDLRTAVLVKAQTVAAESSDGAPAEQVPAEADQGDGPDSQADLNTTLEEAQAFELSIAEADTKCFDTKVRSTIDEVQAEIVRDMEK